MRYRFVPAPVPAAVLAALLTSLTLGGCGAATSDNPAPTTAAAADTIQDVGADDGADTTASSPSSTAGAVLADGRHPAFLKSVDLASRTIVIDVVQFFTGAEAAKAASEDGQESPPPNDYYIRNSNPRLRTLPVQPTARITVNILASDETGDATKNLSVDLVKLSSYFPTEISPLFWVTVRNDRVSALEEQYLP